MIDSFQKLYNDEVLVDCTLSASGGTIRAHKLVLSACSPYFTQLFSTFTNPYQYPVVVMKDMPFTDLKAIIEFMYRGEVTVPQSILPSVLESAKTLSVTGLCDIKIANFESNNKTPASSSSEMFSNRSSQRHSFAKRKRVKRQNSNELSDEEAVMSDNELESKQPAAGSQVQQSENDVPPGDQCESNETPTTGTASHEQEKQDVDEENYSEDDDDDEEEEEEDGEVALELAGAVSGDGNSIFSPNASTSHATVPQLQQQQPQSSSVRPTVRLTPSASLKQDLRQQRIQKLSQTTGGLSGRKIWSDDEVRTLVRVWEEESARVWASAGKKQLSLKRISELLQEQNVDRDLSQVEGKIKALKRDYKAIRMNRAIPSVQARMAPYLDKLHVIFQNVQDSDI